jgi:hypothetical protein
MVRPRYQSNNPFELELGPLELNQSANHLAKQWWLFEEVGGDVFIDKIYGSVRAAAATYLFTSGPVTSLSATFDQLGKPLVFYDTGTELRLWWYDPTQEDHVTSVFGVGSDPFATFDIRYSPSNQGSDAMLFYIRDKAIFYRQQRDRYEVEYATPVDGVDIPATYADIVEAIDLQNDGTSKNSLTFAAPVVADATLDLLCVMYRTRTVPTTPDGWTLYGTFLDLSPAKSYNQHLAVYTKAADSSPVTINNPSTADRFSGFRMQISGVTGITQHSLVEYTATVPTSITTSGKYSICIYTYVFGTSNNTQIIDFVNGTQLGSNTAYANKMAVAKSTVVEDLSISQAQLVAQDPPNAGLLLLELGSVVTAPPISRSASKIIRADMTVDWRLQIAYR